MRIFNIRLVKGKIVARHGEIFTIFNIFFKGCLFVERLSLELSSQRKYRVSIRRREIHRRHETDRVSPG